MSEANKIDWAFIPPQEWREPWPKGVFCPYIPVIDMKPGETLDEAVRRHNEKINAPVARTD